MNFNKKHFSIRNKRTSLHLSNSSCLLPSFLIKVVKEKKSVELNNNLYNYAELSDKSIVSLIMLIWYLLV